MTNGLHEIAALRAAREMATVLDGSTSPDVADSAAGPDLSIKILGSARIESPLAALLDARQTTEHTMRAITSSALASAVVRAVSSVAGNLPRPSSGERATMLTKPRVLQCSCAGMCLIYGGLGSGKSAKSGHRCRRNRDGPVAGAVGPGLLTLAWYVSSIPHDLQLMQRGARWSASLSTLTASTCTSVCVRSTTASTCGYDGMLTANDRFDAILSNPPFDLKEPILSASVSELHGRYGTLPKNRTNFAWLQYVISSLTDSGRAAVVMPCDTLFRGGTESQVRANMIDDGTVEAIIALPSQMFVSTGIPVTVWLLRPPERRREGEILLIDASDLGHLISRTQRSLSDEDQSRIVDTVKQAA